MSTKIYFVAMPFLLIILASCAQTKEVVFEEEIKKAGPKDITLNADVSQLSPEQVVKQYYSALNDKNYKTMYALISDGFKEIEETANTFEKFEAYMPGFYDTAAGIKVLEAKESFNDGKKAEVDYTAEITLKSGAKKELKSAFTMKKTETGWKLIHPYGEKIDTS